MLSQVALQIHEETPPGIAEEIDVVYFPQIGYLIAIDIVNNHYEDLESKDMIGARIGWEYQVSGESCHWLILMVVVHDRISKGTWSWFHLQLTHQVVYFKSQRMLELGR